MSSSMSATPLTKTGPVAVRAADLVK
ncbi:MAG: hypothetical protein QOC80_1099, partial [Frankiaceae bacterium]|nr:hypothetical protein [Frankiaceae bacterium]